MGGGWADWLGRAIIFLVVSCPCALVLSVPLAYFAGIGGASRQGVLVKGAAALEVLAKVKTFVFDKTGTLTRGAFIVTAVHPEELSKEDLLCIAATAEGFSDHPISRSLKAAHVHVCPRVAVTSPREISGKGIAAEMEGKTVYVGNQKLMEDAGVAWHDCDRAGTVVHVALDGKYMGHIVITDELKPGAAELISELARLGVSQTALLTGDKLSVAKEVGAALGINKIAAELLPDGKVEEIERLLSEKQGALAFVGDGINDAPVLARADVGIAMGALGSEAAIEAADVVIMDDSPGKISLALRVALRTHRIVKENIIFALAAKAAVLVLGALGYAPIWLAVFADVGVSLLAVINSLRMLRP
jgi:Cd2+/Zn2+-exporting ATPase